MKLYIKGGNEAKSVKELLSTMFSKKSGYNFISETYHDELCKNYHCGANRRSFGDILTVCKTYFPDCTEEEVAYELLNFKLFAAFCPDIEKVVYHINESDPGWYPNEYVVSTKFRKGRDYSYHQVEKFAKNFKNNNDEKATKQKRLKSSL